MTRIFHFSTCREGLGQVLSLEPIKEESFTSGNGTAIYHNSGSTCVNSPTSLLANNFATSLTLKSPSTQLEKCKRLRSAAHLRSTHFGLNSILDATSSPVANIGTKPKKIRRQSLRTFYGNSIFSPNMMTAVPEGVITVRRSPRFQGMYLREEQIESIRLACSVSL